MIDFQVDEQLLRETKEVYYNCCISVLRMTRRMRQFSEVTHPIDYDTVSTIRSQGVRFTELNRLSKESDEWGPFSSSLP